MRLQDYIAHLVDNNMPGTAARLAPIQAAVAAGDRAEAERIRQELIQECQSNNMIKMVATLRRLEW